MGKLRTLTGPEMIKFVTKLGFVNTDSESSTGSHFRYRPWMADVSRLQSTERKSSVNQICPAYLKP